MNNKKELFEILDEALDRVLKGESIQTVLADYPRHAHELEPLLKTALETRDAAAIQPRPEFRQRAALEFQKAIQKMPVKYVAKMPGTKDLIYKPRRGIFGRGMAWSVSLVVIIVVLLSGTGVVTASTQAMPDSPLYGVKLVAENVQLALTPGQNGKAELLSKFNDRRVTELVEMADKGNAAEVSALNSRISSNIDKILEITGGQIMASSLDTNISQETAFGTSAAAPSQQETTLAASQPVPPDTTAASTTTALVPTTTLAGLPFTPTQVPVTTKVPVATTAVTPVTTKAPLTTVAPVFTTEPPVVTTKVPVVTQPKVTPKLTVVLPTPTRTPAPAPTRTTRTINPPTTKSNDHNDRNNKNQEDNWAKLQKHLSEKQIKNLKFLLEAYVKANDSLKSHILESIKIIVFDPSLTTENDSVINDILEKYGLSLDQLAE
jgi:hypothetical protein